MVHQRNIQYKYGLCYVYLDRGLNANGPLLLHYSILLRTVSLSSFQDLVLMDNRGITIEQLFLHRPNLSGKNHRQWKVLSSVFIKLKCQGFFSLLSHIFWRAWLFRNVTLWHSLLQITRLYHQFASGYFDVTKNNTLEERPI